MRVYSKSPNPFNHETWIPCRLAEDANVTLTIYDTSGLMVRRLDLGQRIAGFCESRSKAIHWMVVTISGMKWQVAFISIICLQETIPPRGRRSSLDSKRVYFDRSVDKRGKGISIRIYYRAGFAMGFLSQSLYVPLIVSYPVT